MFSIPTRQGEHLSSEYWVDRERTPGLVSHFSLQLTFFNVGLHLSVYVAYKAMRLMGHIHIHNANMTLNYHYSIF